MANIEQRTLTSGSWWLGHKDRAAIVDHIMQGNIQGSESRFNNKSEEVSAHFGVGRSGRIVQWVSLNNSAWANGVLEPGYDNTMPWLVECDTKEINPNWVTVSIEHEGNSGDYMPELQYQATLQLHIFIIKLYPSIKPGRKTIVPHRAISPSSKPFCPGVTFPFDRLITDLQKEFPVMSNYQVPGNFPVRPEFSAFWWQFGGLKVFGYPITTLLPANGNYGQAAMVQYFERARFELQPDGSVMLGLVGREAMADRLAGGLL